jgi:hypothetical protein
MPGMGEDQEPIEPSRAAHPKRDMVSGVRYWGGHPGQKVALTAVGPQDGAGWLANCIVREPSGQRFASEHAPDFWSVLHLCHCSHFAQIVS